MKLKIDPVPAKIREHQKLLEQGVGIKYNTKQVRVRHKKGIPIVEKRGKYQAKIVKLHLIRIKSYALFNNKIQPNPKFKNINEHEVYDH